MLFNTWTFLTFALIVFGLYYRLPHRWQNRLLLVASYIFYGAWDWRFLSLIWLSTIVDFVTGRAIAGEVDPKRKRLWLTVSCATNLGLLGVFKYAGFFAQSFADLAGVFGWNPGIVTLNIVLPVGISFYTFQTMSYTIDIYRGRLSPVRSFEDFALFVAYFPQLVAGPIERASHLLPQLVEPRSVSRSQVREGAWLIGWGLFKKAVIADNIAPRVDEVFFAGNDWASGGACLLAIYGFAIQIYCDFSGYSDVARGLGKLMGIDIMRNFQIPYVATSPQEFWRRWHISLSTWLRDYLYIPLGGNRFGGLQTYRNLMLTMVLGGLWHGAAWTFVLWGFYQGALLAVHRWFVVDRVAGAGTSGAGAGAARKTHPSKEKPGWARLPRAVLSWLVMFHLVCLGWLIFRAESVGQIWSFLGRIFTGPGLRIDEAHLLWPLLFFGGVLVVVDAWIRNADDPTTRPGWNRGLGPIAVTALVVLALVFWPPRIQQFIYFQF